MVVGLVLVFGSSLLVVACWVLIVGCLLFRCLLVVCGCRFSVVVAAVFLVFRWHGVRRIGLRFNMCVMYVYILCMHRMHALPT